MITINKKADKIFKYKLFFFLIVILGSFVVLMGKLIHINAIDEKPYKQIVLNQQVDKMNKSSVQLFAKRGTIFDKNCIPLARSAVNYTIIYDPAVLLDYEEKNSGAIQRINKEIYVNLDIEEGILEKLLKDKKNSSYEKIATEVEHESCAQLIEKIDNGELRGVTYEKKYKRMYPYDTLACGVIGFYKENVDNLWGIERIYNEYLKGESGRRFGIVDENEEFVVQDEPPIDGYDVILNIDYTVQTIVEESIASFYEKEDANSISIIIMDPRNGEVLAMASYPNFDLNNPYDLSNYFTPEEIETLTDEEVTVFRNNLWRNSNISDTYEPGSTFKPFTLAMGLEEHTVDDGTIYYCGGSKIPFEGEKPIHCHKRSGHEYLDYVNALGYSCNVAFMDMGLGIGRKNFAKYQRTFGFSSVTNIDINGETSARNLVYNESQLNPVELQTSSFGQGFNVTPIQLITGFSALVNGGYLYEPHVMNKIVDSEGNVVFKNEKKLQRVVISKEVSDKVSSALKNVVDDGTGTKAEIKGYSIGGKTGTAEKGDRETKNYVVSFIGYSPVINPEVIALVVIDEPTGDQVSSAQAANLFREMMEKVLPYLRITKDYTALEEE